jgi:hypothetical protein
MTALSFRLDRTGARRGDDGAEVTQAVPEPPQETGGEPGPAPQPKPDAPAPEGAQMTVPGQFWATIRFAFRTARRRAADITAAEGGWVNAALNGKPPSINDQRDYMNQRRWLEPGHEGGIADLLGEAYHAAYGVLGVAIGNAFSWLFAKPFHSTGAAAGFLTGTLVACKVSGLSFAHSALITVALAALMIAPVAVAAGALALRRAGARWWAGRRTVTVTTTQEEGD